MLESNPSAVFNSNTAGRGGLILRRKIPGGNWVQSSPSSNPTTKTNGMGALAFLANHLLPLKPMHSAVVQSLSVKNRSESVSERL